MVRRHFGWFVGLAAVIVAVLSLGGAIGAILLGHKIFTNKRTHPTVSMGPPVRDGNFRFIANRMQCGIDQLGTPDDYQVPTGQFCVVQLKITNVGKEPGVYADSIQDAFSPDGSRYTADTPAAYYANPDPLVFLNEINPGNHVDIAIVYDIPKSGSIAKLELHESPHTRGAIVKVQP